MKIALLDIKKQSTGLFAVTWKVPTRGDKVLAITPVLPGILELVGTPTRKKVPGSLIEHSTYKISAGLLPGQMIKIEGLNRVQTDVLLLIELQDGSQHSAIFATQCPPSLKFRWKHRNSRLPATSGCSEQSISPRAQTICCSCWPCGSS